jgi:hypothetical protein
VYFSGSAGPNGTFTFDDIPAGDYQLHVNAFAVDNHSVGPGEVIANLDHQFAVMDSAGEKASEPLDLGELTLQSAATPRPAP